MKEHRKEIKALKIMLLFKAEMKLKKYAVVF